MEHITIEIDKLKLLKSNEETKSTSYSANIILLVGGKQLLQIFNSKVIQDTNEDGETYTYVKFPYTKGVDNDIKYYLVRILDPEFYDEIKVKATEAINKLNASK